MSSETVTLTAAMFCYHSRNDNFILMQERACGIPVRYPVALATSKLDCQKLKFCFICCTRARVPRCTIFRNVV
jgi:hypothetical protein